MMEIVDWFSFFLILLATFLGVFLAFLLNGVYNRLVEKTRARRLLFLLKEEIEKNIDLLQQLDVSLKDPNYVPFYDLKFVFWNSITPNIINALEKINIIKDISNFYFELQHIERKINRLFTLSFNPNITKDTLFSKELLVNSLNVHIPGVLMGKNCKSPQALVAKIECLIKELK